MAFTEGQKDGTLNGTTAVDVIDAPAASTRRICTTLSIFNADTAAVTVTVRYNNNGTSRIICKATLQVGERLSLDQNDLTILDATTKKIQALLAAAAATTNPDYVSTYADAT